MVLDAMTTTNGRKNYVGVEEEDPSKPNSNSEGVVAPVQPSLLRNGRLKVWAVYEFDGVREGEERKQEGSRIGQIMHENYLEKDLNRKILSEFVSAKV